jgi:hypothetical protein
VGDGGGDGHEHHVAVRHGLGGGGGDVPVWGARCWDNVVHVGVAGGVLSGLDHVHGALRDVDAPDVEACVVEPDGGGQADVTETNDANGTKSFERHMLADA